MKVFVFYFVLVAVIALFGHVVFHIIKKKRLEVNDSFAIIAILIGVLALPSLNEASENPSAVSSERNPSDSTSSVDKPEISVSDSSSDTENGVPKTEAVREEKATRTITPKQSSVITVDSAQIQFNMPELVQSSWCNDPGSGIVEFDSLLNGVVKVTSIGAKGRMVGLYDPATKRPLDYTLYINKNEFGETRFSKLIESSIFDSEQELQFWIHRGEHVKFENFTFDIVYTDALGNRYTQRAKPRISFDCVVHDLTKPKMIR